MPGRAMLRRYTVRLIAAAIAISAAMSACVQTQAPQKATPKAAAAAGHAAAPIDINAAVAHLRTSLRREVPRLIVDAPGAAQRWIALAQSQVAASDLTIARPQLLVVVDRNPQVQQMRIVMAQAPGSWEDLGGTTVSTGQTGRRGYYVTPTGVFMHTDAILDWRAAGTYNEQHIRGLGIKGMRVWDFGWQRAAKGWGTGEDGEIRLLLHATDPDYLEQRLGRAASKGCVRIPDAMNRFLDRYGILDADYQDAAKNDPRFAALLLRDRTPTPLAGDALVVVDSAKGVPAAMQEPNTLYEKGPPTMGKRHGRLASAARFPMP
jgi:lipoprotein-anchoring transpeptidase ErfK/SrfK